MSGYQGEVRINHLSLLVFCILSVKLERVHFFTIYIQKVAIQKNKNISNNNNRDVLKWFPLPLPQSSFGQTDVPGLYPIDQSGSLKIRKPYRKWKPNLNLSIIYWKQQYEQNTNQLKQSLLKIFHFHTFLYNTYSGKNEDRALPVVLEKTKSQSK